MNVTQSMHEDPEHREIWLNLPWYVNDSIDAQQRERIEAHLQACAPCRAELAQQRTIHSVMSADTGIEILPSAALARLRHRMAEQSPQVAPQKPAASQETHRRVLMAAAIAGIAVSLSVVMINSTHSPAGSSEGSYRTVSSAAPRPAQEAIRAVFAPDTTMARLQGLLESSQLRIVAGPTEAGVYSLALTGDQQVGAALSQLRQQPDVRFAESTVPLERGKPQ
jgi:hypothetical protein